MLLCRIIMLIIMLLSSTPVKTMEGNILEILTVPQNVIVYSEGNKINIDSDSFETIKTELEKLVSISREAPAFGVSLHDETIEAMKSGLWIEFEYNKTITHNEMPFESLLINVVGDYNGFNIIRKYENKYYGRCFYVYLNNYNMSALEKAIMSII